MCYIECYSHFTISARAALMAQEHRTLLLGRADIRRTMTLADYIDAVEQAFARLGSGGMVVPAVVHIPAPDGAFHVKSAGYVGQPGYVAVKINGNFPNNPANGGLPTIQGAIVLCDARNGALLAVVDSIEVTAMRTGAATAVAARRLARQDASVITVIGCGVQGLVQLAALSEVLPLEKAWAFDTDAQRRAAFADAAVAETGLDVVPVDDFSVATAGSHVIVTCTPAREPFLRREHVAPGTFIAAVGADNHDKRELHADLMAGAKVIVDVLDQCAEIGELHHALDEGVMTRADVVAELADVVAGTVEPRIGRDDIVVFDSTGTAIEDVAAAGIIYERARAGQAGLSLAFAQ